MDLIPQILSGVMVVGGAGTFVYYSVGQSNGTSISSHIEANHRTLISDPSKWQEKEALYKKLDEKSEEMISGVENRDSTKTKVWMKIRNWCEKTKNKVFVNYWDKTYQSFSQWCLEEINVQKKLELEGLEDGSSKLTELLKDYEESGSRFITGTGDGEGGKKKVTNDDLKNWCSKNKSITFKHEMDSTYLNVKKFCYLPKTGSAKSKDNSKAASEGSPSTAKRN
ncbi:hypothetical protein MHF_1452 [Mycoplasma haemofelis Ohio2]|uniref:Uncharacterized protein n=1 Tax=Mycoplasma haemofelis (strain Ohio2) TaxID=859194 RepID=F6FGX7_MYCHI|nr:hypothetical protein MHF_1452 [Mycoplasma haemofelis Ohio2]